MLPLEGITVLDLTRFLPGAVATMCLLRFGAEVIKIERPGEGDPARHLAGGNVFAYTNRGKKSIAIDLKHEKGKNVFRDLTATADVVFENFRPGVMERLGVGFDTLAQLNRRLIYVAMTGYDPAGPMRSAAGHDINYISISGTLDLLSHSDGQSPRIPRIQLADIAGGSHQVTTGILLALYARERTGVGQRVDVAMASAIGDLLAMPLATAGTAPQVLEEGLFSGRFACYNLYRCKDERWIAVGALEPKFWARLCRELGRDDLAGQQFIAEPDQSLLKMTLGAIFQQRNAGDWISRLGERDCCVTPVRTLEEAYAAGHFKSDDIGAGARLSNTPARPCSELKPPALGEHVAELRTRLQMSQECLTQLKRDGVIA